MSQQMQKRPFRRGIELGFRNGVAAVYGGEEPVGIDAQMGKGKFTRLIGVNTVSPRTAHFTKIVTDVKDGEIAWATWKTLERQGYKPLFLNTDRLYGYPTQSYNPFTPVIEAAQRPELHGIVDNLAYDAARFLIPIEPDSKTKWVGQGCCTMAAVYIANAALHPSEDHPCTPGGLWDFFGRGREEIALDLKRWSRDPNRETYAKIAELCASITESPDQWNAYSSVFMERLLPYREGTAARAATDWNSFDPAAMKNERTALFIMGSARSKTSRDFVGSMTAAIIDRFADGHGPLRALVIGEEWGQLYVSNFYEILTLYRQAGIHFLGVFQNAAAQIETRYGKETARLWKKAVAHTIYRGLPDTETLRDIEHRSGKTSVMVRGYNVSSAQVNGSGDNWSEQSRPLLQVEDIRALTGGAYALLDSRDEGFFQVAVPNFWERSELSGMIRDVRTKPDKYAWLDKRPRLAAPAATMDEDDTEILALLDNLSNARGN
jgi:type IV secretion system protein VirD4